MTIVALTGGIGAGKSTVTGVLRDHGVLVIDADEIARAAVEPGSPGLAGIVKAFGDSVVLPDGTLNRALLGERVFADPAQRELLNSIVHPEVRRLSAERIARAEQEEPERVLVYDIPLLAESGRTEEWDLIVLVHAPREVRIDRLVSYRGMSREEATARVDSQASDRERLQIADAVLDSSRTLDETLEAAHRLADALRKAWPDRLDSVAQFFPKPPA